MAVNIPIPGQFDSIVNADGTMQQAFSDWVRRITEQVNLRAVQTGTGSPEDNLAAKATVEYMDISGTAGNIKYIKQVNDIAGDTKKGWVLV